MKKLDDLVLKYPNAFEKNEKGESLAYFECQDGWSEIIEPILSYMHKYNSENQDGHIYPSQVKEKWGTLSFYINSGTDEIFQIIEEAENKSGHICEICGKPGKVRTGGWIVTRCDEHSKK